MKFTYKVITPTGGNKQSTIEAASSKDAIRLLKSQKFVIISLKSKDSEKHFSFSFILSLFQKVPVREKIIFTRQLAVMVKSGLPLVEAISALEEQSENKQLKKVLHNVVQDVKVALPFLLP